MTRRNTSTTATEGAMTDIGNRILLVLDQPRGHLTVRQAAQLAGAEPIDVLMAAAAGTLPAEPGELRGVWWIVPAHALAWATTRQETAR